MPADYWTEAGRMMSSGLLVAAIAIPLGLIARGLRPKQEKGEPFLPRYAPWRVPWSGYDVLAAFLLWRLMPMALFFMLDKAGFYTAVYGPDFPALNANEVDEANTIRVLWAYLFAMPLTVGLLWLGARLLYPQWRPTLAGRREIAGRVWLALVAWCVITPLVLVFNSGVNELFNHFDVEPAKHPLAKLGHRPLLDRILLSLQACAAAPMTEELFFRWILLAWCVGRTRFLDAGTAPSTAVRPWFVMAAAGVLAVLEGKSLAPRVFAGILALWTCRRLAQDPHRRGEPAPSTRPPPSSRSRIPASGPVPCRSSYSALLWDGWRCAPTAFWCPLSFTDCSTRCRSCTF